MSITQKKLRIKNAPRSTGSRKGERYLKRLLNTNIDYPQMQIAGLSENELSNIDQMQGFLENGTEGENLAMSEFKKTLAGDYDPRTSDYYQGLRQEMNDMKNESNAAIRRRSNLGGMVNSTISAGNEADNSRKYDNFVLQQLGSMYENERGRRTGAASGANQIGQQRVSNLVGSQGMISAPRQIQQEQLNAEYLENLQEVLAPYTVMALIANNLMNYQQDYYSIGGGDKDWVKDFGIISGMAGGLFM